MTIAPYSDNWDQSLAFDAVLFDNLDMAFGQSLVCQFGSGRQGHVYLDDDNRIVKVTRSLEEGLLALYLQLNPSPIFPKVADIRRLLIENVPLLAIRRDFVNDLIEDPSDHEREVLDCVKEAWTQMHFLGQAGAPEVQTLASCSPFYHQKLFEFKAALDTFTTETGIYVSDLHSDNFGLSDDKQRIVVRDFGMSNIRKVIDQNLLDNIPLIDVPAPSLTI
jgi:hypothetical protein